MDYTSSSSSSSESVEQPPVPPTTPSSIYVHSVTTIETSISVDYGAPTPPTPTPYFPPYTTMRAEQPPPPAAPTSQEEETTTRHVWSEVPTTAAPFFTEYPAEVLITTHRTSAGRFTTVQPPPAQQETTMTVPHVDYESPSPAVLATTAQTPHIVVTILEGDATPPQTTAMPPSQPLDREPSTTLLPPPAVTMPTQLVEQTTQPQPMITEDLQGPVVQPTPQVTTIAPPPRETTQRPVVVVTLPPATEQPPVTVPPTPPSTQSAQTLPPPTPPLHVYSTPGQPELPTQTKSPSSVTESSEETEGANTVATGGGRVPPGGAEEKSGDVDCIKLGCYNGGTCVTTSEGSRVSKPIVPSPSSPFPCFSSSSSRSAPSGNR